MLLDYSNQCRKVKSSEGFKLYIEGQLMHTSEVLQFLPIKSDKNLMGYHKRMEEYFPDYCLVCDELLQTSQKNWKYLQEFTSNLFSFVGFPNRFVEMGLYLGNYRKTPFGVHVDGCGVFSFPVAGHKTFRLWKPSFAAKNPSLDRAQNYNRFKKDSTTMKAIIGDMTYWPSSAWHIAESDGSFNATWSLGVWLDRTHLENVEHALKPVLRKKMGLNGMTTATKNFQVKNDGEVRTLSENDLNSIKLIKMISKEELHDSFMYSWLQKLSMQGFKTAQPSTMKTPFSLKSDIQLPESQTILWSHLKLGSKVLYAYQGTVLESDSSTNFHNLISDLNRGRSCKLSDFLKGNKKSKELIFIQNLLSPAQGPSFISKGQ